MTAVPNARSALRIVRDTLENIEAGRVDAAVAIRTLEAHASYCLGIGDAEGAESARAAVLISQELERKASNKKTRKRAKKSRAKKRDG